MNNHVWRRIQFEVYLDSVNSFHIAYTRTSAITVLVTGSKLYLSGEQNPRKVNPD